MAKTTPQHDFVRGIWNENPVLVQMSGAGANAGFVSGIGGYEYGRKQHCNGSGNVLCPNRFESARRIA